MAEGVQLRDNLWYWAIPTDETAVLQGLRSSGLSPHLPGCTLNYTFDSVDNAIEARKLIDAHFGLDRNVTNAQNGSEQA